MIINVIILILFYLFNKEDARDNESVNSKCLQSESTDSYFYNHLLSFIINYNHLLSIIIIYYHLLSFIIIYNHLLSFINILICYWIMIIN